jgi:3-hydroxyacyl-CoA dehydrogenase
VEVIRSVLTSEAVAGGARAFVTEVLGKTAISAPDRSGFVVNALLVPHLLAAIRMLEAGHATTDDIDTGMALGSHPMGPLRLADLIGLDTLQAVAASMYEEYKEPRVVVSESAGAECSYTGHSTDLNPLHLQQVHFAAAGDLNAVLVSFAVGVLRLQPVPPLDYDGKA